MGAEGQQFQHNSIMVVAIAQEGKLFGHSELVHTHKGQIPLLLHTQQGVFHEHFHGRIEIDFLVFMEFFRGFFKTRGL